MHFIESPLSNDVSVVVVVSVVSSFTSTEECSQTMCNGSLSVDHIIEQFNERPERKGQAYRMMNRDEAFRLLEDAAKSDDIHLYLIWK